MKRIPLLLIWVLTAFLSVVFAREERVAILGDSIPYAGGWPTLVTEGLHQSKQYADATIVNICVPSETVAGLSEPGHAGGAFPRPCLHDRLARVLAEFKPTLVIACYGMNDGLYKPLDPGRFESYKTGIIRLKKEAEAAGARVILVTPPPYRGDQLDKPQDEYDKTLSAYGEWLVSQRKNGWDVIDIRPYVKKGIAEAKKSKPGFVYAGDGVHPGDAGHRLIGEAVCSGLTKLAGVPAKVKLPEGADYQDAFKKQEQLRNEWLNRTKHQRPQIPGYVASIPRYQDADAKMSDWNGFEKSDFKFENRNAMLVFPKKAAQGNPWIWRTEFFGHEPQADIELLKNGFAVAYVDMQDMYASPAAKKVMDAFYKHLKEKYELSRRTVLEGFSRGGLYAFNWAALHPEWVAAIYADAPVCDFKSWPAGKGKGALSKENWEKLLAAYGMTEAQALAWKGNPVDNLKSMAKAKVPVICVARTEDTVVPFKENTAVLAERYKKLSGPIKVVLGPGNHHPHSLKNPAVIVKFILDATAYPVSQRIVCMGDSITFGHGVPQAQRWSNVLADKLGAGYTVENYGVSARTLLSKGDHPYIREAAYTNAVQAKADIALIALGTNDAKPQNWKFKDEFAKDYKAIIEALRKENPEIKIYCLKAIPSLLGDDSISGTRVAKEVNPQIEKVARQMKCTVVDLYTPMKPHPEFLPDKVHPNAAGHAVMAETLYKALVPAAK